MKKNKKICLISSSGGHFEQLQILKELKNRDESIDIYTITEKTEYNGNEKKTYYVMQINRKELLAFFKFFVNFIQSFYIFMKEKPDVIISTGALSIIPTFLIGKVFRKQIIFIESFAKVTTPTLTGKFVYKFANIFIVQWEELLSVYPKAIYLGSIY